MPNARYLAQPSLVIDSIHNAVRAKDNFANLLIMIFENHAPEVRKIG